MAHRITIEVDLLEKQLCSGCPCVTYSEEHSKCALDYWDTREAPRNLVWYNWRTGEFQEPSDTDHTLSTKDGWGYHTRRPQQCIDEKG